MTTITKQLAEQLGSKAEWINSVTVDEKAHLVDFKEGQKSYWAKLSTDNKVVKKNSVKLA